MTVAELIERLRTCNADAVVMIYDADSEQDEAVTGLVCGSDVVTLHSDDPA